MPNTTVSGNYAAPLRDGLTSSRSATSLARVNVTITAIDSGDTAAGPAFDQRGVARPQAKRPRLPAITDMGAFEFVR